MKTIAESANDFRDLRTKKSPCVYAIGLSFDSMTHQFKDLIAEEIRQ